MVRSNSVQTRIFFWAALLVSLLLSLPIGLATSTVGQSPGDLVINEFVAANQTGLTDEDGDYADWIELYNRGEQVINLAGWSLTDDPAEPEKWTFPEVTLGSQEYLLVFASGKDRQAAQPNVELHTNFKLSQEGEFLGLYSIFQAQFVDVTSPAAPVRSDGEINQKFPEQLADVSYGRYRHQAHDRAYGYFQNPTPGQPNDETSGWAGLVAPVTFSIERGFYEIPFTLELATTTPGAIIRYTTDGSEPTETGGVVYTAPLTISSTSLVRAAAFKPNFRTSPAVTHSYIFLDDVLTQPQNPAGFPGTWGGYKGAPVLADYEMDPEVVNDPRYRPVIKEALRAIPTLSLVTDMPNFYHLYANPGRRGRAWERPVSVELLDPQNSRSGFQINAGLRMHGELGRSGNIPKHPMRLFFRSEYGAARLHYPLFPGSPVDEFDTLILRSGVNRSYAGFPKWLDALKLTTYTRDEWLRASQLAVSGYGARGRFVHLYLNGLYWGLYNIVERPDEAFMSAHFGGGGEDWQVVDHDTTVANTSQRFKALHQLAQEGDLQDPEKYAAIQTYLDIPHFMDYLILNWYSGNLDWGFNNWFAAVQNPAGQVRYFVWDGERTWFDGAEIYIEYDDYEGQPNLVKPLFNALLENPDFRVKLADRMYRHLFHDGPLADANAQARWLSLNQEIEQAIIGESARWGDTRFETPLTQADWFKARDDVLRQMEGNAARLMALARQEGYYPKLDPPAFSQQGGQIAPGFILTITGVSPGEGAILYTTDGSDPRQPVTGAIASTANTYRTPLILTSTTHLKARVFRGGVWSALNEASFTLEAEFKSRLQITEIMYNPVGGDDYEFIELKNVGSSDLELSRLSFVEGIRFTFPPNSPALAPQQLLVLVRNPAAFAQRYPGVRVAGVYQGQLSNKGETLRLQDAQGQDMIWLDYDDENGWPVSADGQGDSLVWVDVTQDPNSPVNWRASVNLKGSPGADERMVSSLFKNLGIQAWLR
ncbi:MAG: lamin tail domain-containing protein [Anaerolineae bacterium]|nr:lamin tail domain-containing protein [Anaerolineae bacterium]